MLSKSISTSEKLNNLRQRCGDLGEFAQLLYTWIIPHTDDYGRMSASPFSIKMTVMPASDRSLDEFKTALNAMHDEGLIILYKEKEDILEIVSFEEHQQGLHKRTKSRFPDPPELNRIEQKGTEGKVPEHSRKFQEIPGNVNSSKEVTFTPYKAIVDLYHDICCKDDGLPKVRTVIIDGTPHPYIKGELVKNLNGRWNENDTQKNLEWWGKFFTVVSESDFLMGRVPGRDGRKTFRANLAWLVKPNNFAKVVDFRYSEGVVNG